MKKFFPSKLFLIGGLAGIVLFGGSLILEHWNAFISNLTIPSAGLTISFIALVYGFLKDYTDYKKSQRELLKERETKNKQNFEEIKDLLVKEKVSDAESTTQIKTMMRVFEDINRNNDNPQFKLIMELFTDMLDSLEKDSEINEEIMKKLLNIIESKEDKKE
jgi:hypothetical protein